jgi:hypothetical protein
MAIHLKPGIRGRATFTPGDGFDRGLAGARGVTGLDHLWPLFVHGEERLTRLAFAEATGFAYDPEMRVMAESGHLPGYDWRYYEAQIHGNISWSDIDRIIIYCKEGSDKELSEAAEAADRLERFASGNGYHFPVQVLRKGQALAQLIRAGELADPAGDPVIDAEPQPVAVRGVSGPGAGRGVVVPLSAEQLRWSAQWALTVPTEIGAGVLQGCAGVADRLLRQWYPGLLRAAADDGVAGLGGLAGVQQRLLPGPGWAAVGSWARLTRAVRAAGPGASVVVVVVASSPGSREAGHAVLGHVTADDELRWVDPLDGSVSETGDPPASVRGPAAARAVVVGPDGRPAEPGDWAAESAGAVGPLVDAPLRHDVGRMGQEEEQHDYVLYLPGRWRLPENT